MTDTITATRLSAGWSVDGLSVGGGRLYLSFPAVRALRALAESGPLLDGPRTNPGRAIGATQAARLARYLLITREPYTPRWGLTPGGRKVADAIAAARIAEAQA